MDANAEGKELVMRHIALVVSFVAMAVTGLAGWRPPSLVAAQEGTPQGEMTMAGVDVETLTFAAAEVLPPAPAALVLQRYRLEPGAVQSSEATDPSLAFIYQESGTATIRIAAPILVTRAGATPGEPGAQEEIPADTDFTFGPGDSFAWPPFVAGEVRNEGSEPAMALVVIVAPQEAATPTP
jgi:hypothetical protein